MFGDAIKALMTYEDDKIHGRNVLSDKVFWSVIIGVIISVLGAHGVHLDSHFADAAATVIVGIVAVAIPVVTHLSQSHVGIIKSPVQKQVLVVPTKDPMQEEPKVEDKPKVEEHNLSGLYCFIFFLILAWPLSAFAVHLGTNPEACNYYVVSGLPANFTAAANVTGDPTGKAGMSLDLSALPVVTTNTQWTVTVECCLSQTTTSTGGCSTASNPFTFMQNAVPAAPSGLAVAP